MESTKLNPAQIKREKGNLLRAARKALAKYPQYKGYFNESGWKVSRITRKDISKGGLQANKGDLVISKVDSVKSLGGLKPNLSGFTYFSNITTHLRFVRSNRIEQLEQ